MEYTKVKYTTQYYDYATGKIHTEDGWFLMSDEPQIFTPISVVDNDDNPTSKASHVVP